MVTKKNIATNNTFRQIANYLKLKGNRFRQVANRDAKLEKNQVSLTS